jgi:hypothetical protein
MLMMGADHIARYADYISSLFPQLIVMKPDTGISIELALPSVHAGHSPELILRQLDRYSAFLFWRSGKIAG